VSRISKTGHCGRERDEKAAVEKRSICWPLVAWEI
jgi:hypothetical protein